MRSPSHGFNADARTRAAGQLLYRDVSLRLSEHLVLGMKTKRERTYTHTLSPCSLPQTPGTMNALITAITLKRQISGILERLDSKDMAGILVRRQNPRGLLFFLRLSVLVGESQTRHLLCGCIPDRGGSIPASPTSTGHETDGGDHPQGGSWEWPRWEIRVLDISKQNEAKKKTPGWLSLLRVPASLMTPFFLLNA